MKNETLKLLLTELLEELQERFAAEVLRRTEVSKIRCFGRNVRFVYADGRSTIYSPDRYPGEPRDISAYDAMQLGEELPELSPSRVSPWLNAVLPAVAGIGLLPLALFGAFRKKTDSP